MSERNSRTVFRAPIGFQVIGLMPDAEGLGKPTILMAKRIQPAGADA